MKNELKEYLEAFEHHMKVQSQHLELSKEVQLSRFKLLKAREAMRMKEYELLEIN